MKWVSQRWAWFLFAGIGLFYMWWAYADAQSTAPRVVQDVGSFVVPFAIVAGFTNLPVMRRSMPTKENLQSGRNGRRVAIAFGASFLVFFATNYAWQRSVPYLPHLMPGSVYFVLHGLVMTLFALPVCTVRNPAEVNGITPFQLRAFAAAFMAAQWSIMLLGLSRTNDPAMWRLGVALAVAFSAAAVALVPNYGGTTRGTGRMTAA
jgi:hypothetical protein